MMHAPSSGGTVEWGAGTTWNPSDKSENITLSGGNLIATAPSVAGSVRSTTSKSSGKSAFEVVMTSLTGACSFGVATSLSSLSKAIGFTAESIGWYSATGDIRFNSSVLASASAIAQGNVIGIVLDRSNNTLAFYKGGVLVVSVSCSSPSGGLFAAVYASAGSSVTAKFSGLTYAYP